MRKYKTVGNRGLFDEEDKKTKQGHGDEFWGDNPKNINKQLD